MLDKYLADKTYFSNLSCDIFIRDFSFYPVRDLFLFSQFCVFEKLSQIANNINFPFEMIGVRSVQQFQVVTDSIVQSWRRKGNHNYWTIPTIIFIQSCNVRNSC